MSFVRLIVTVNIGKSPEQRTLPTGRTLTEFSGAVNIGSKDKKNTTWFDFRVWGDKCKGIMPYVQQGKKFTIVATPYTDEWEHEGKKQRRTRWDVESIDFAGDSSGGSHDASPAPPPGNPIPFGGYPASSGVDTDNLY
jgi:single-stranded DNA-binding protein